MNIMIDQNANDKLFSRVQEFTTELLQRQGS